MKISNLCLLWTFILSLTNIIGITHISWFAVLAPTVFMIIMLILIIIAASMAVVMMKMDK